MTPGYPDASRSGLRAALRSRRTGILLAAGFALYLGLFAFNSLTRWRAFTPDSMNYVDVARNVAAGRGLVQSTLGYNQLDFTEALKEDAPVPFLAQGPLYPILIALVSLSGVSAANAALLVSLACYAAVLFIAYRIAGELYDAPSALIAAGFLVLLAPLTLVARTAWSEPLALALLLASLWLLLRAHRSGAVLALSAGAAAGLAVSARYALFPLVAAGALFLLLERRRIWIAFLAGAVAAAAPAAVRVLAAWHRGALGHDASDTGLARNALHVLTELTGRSLGLFPSGLETAVVSLVVVGLLLRLRSRDDLRSALRDVFLRDRRRLLLLWTLLYIAFLVLERTLVRLDRIDARLVSPGAATAAILAAALAARALRLGRRRAILVAAAALLAATAREVHVAVSRPFVDEDRRIAASERLRWISERTTARDLIVGENAVDVPFYFGRPAVSFSPYPRHHPDYAALAAFAERREEEGRVYLVLRGRGGTEEQDRARFGPFIADLRAGRLGAYPRALPVAILADGEVFELLRGTE